MVHLLVQFIGYGDFGIICAMFHLALRRSFPSTLRKGFYIVALHI